MDNDEYPFDRDTHYHDTEMSRAVRVSNMTRKIPPGNIKQYYVHAEKAYESMGEEVEPLLKFKDERKRVSIGWRIAEFTRQGTLREDPSTSDLRAWELFVILAGWYPANASQTFKEEVKNHITERRISTTVTVLSNSKLKQLYGGFFDSNIFGQVCLYGVVHDAISRVRRKRKKANFQIKEFGKFGEWVELFIKRWNKFLRNAGEALSELMHFEVGDLKLTMNDPGQWTKPGGMRSICYEAEESDDEESEEEESEEGRPTGVVEELFREAGRRMLESIYSIADIYLEGKVDFSEPAIPGDLEIAIGELERRKGEIEIADFVNGHLNVKRGRMKVQRFPTNICSFLKGELELDEPIARLKKMPFNRWRAASVEKVKQFQIQEGTTLANTDAAAHGLYIAPSRIPNAGKGLFTSKVITAGECIAPFWGLWIDEDISTHAEMDDDSTFGVDGYLFTKKRFIDYALGCTPPEKNDTTKAWIVPAIGCSAAYANDPFAYRADGTCTNELIDENRPGNAEFEYNVERHITDRSSDRLRLHATKRMGEDTEILVPYGSRYIMNVRASTSGLVEGK